MDFRILGPLEVWAGAEPLPIPVRGRMTALLTALLLNRNQVVAEERLLRWLWGDEDGRDAKVALQNLISRLRGALAQGGAEGRGILFSRSPGYGLRVELGATDADRFEDALSAARRHRNTDDPAAAAVELRNGLALWRGPALGALADEPFALGESGRLEELRMGALEDLMEVRLSLGENGAGIAAVVGELKALVTAHPLRERFYCQLMLALYRTGRQAEALEVFRAGRRLLVDELGIEPGPQLQAMERAVLQQDPGLTALPCRRNSRPTPSLPAQTPGGSASTMCGVVVGREGELAILNGALEQATRGSGRVAVLRGDAGIGKTRLADEVTGQAGIAGHLVLRGNCADLASSLPYLPFVEALADHVVHHNGRRSSVDPALRAMFPGIEVRPEARIGMPLADAKLALFDAVTALVHTLAKARTLVLVIEDLHWADVATVELLDYTARHIARSAVLIVATCRDDEVDRGHPFSTALCRWRRESWFFDVPLGPLTAPHIGAMCQVILQTSHVGNDLATELHARCEGIPFVLEEILKESIVGDHLRSSHARSGWARLDQIPLPRSVTEAILLRVERLSDDQVGLLRAASVLGRVFPFGLLTEMAGVPDDTLHDALEGCIRQQLLEEDPLGDERFRFRHALTHEVVYEDISLPRRRALHGRAVSALRTRAAPPFEIAHHLVSAGRGGEAVPFLLDAADAAMRAYAAHEAASLMERALAFVEDDSERSAILCRLGEALHLAGEHRRAQRHLDDGLRSVGLSMPPTEEARFRLVLGRCHWEAARKGIAREEYERAFQLVEPFGVTGTLAGAYGRLAELEVLDHDGDVVRGKWLATRAMAVAEQAGAEAERLSAMGRLGQAHFGMGEQEEGLAYMDRSWQEARAQGLRSIAVLFLRNAAHARLEVLRLHEVPALLEQLREVGMASDELEIVYLEAAIALEAGPLRSAYAAFSRVQEMSADRGSVRYNWWARGRKGTILVLMGCLDEARALVEENARADVASVSAWSAADWWMATLTLSLAVGDIGTSAACARDYVTAGRYGECAEGDLAVAALLDCGLIDEAERLAQAMADWVGHMSTRVLVGRTRARLALARGDAAAACSDLRTTADALERAGCAIEWLDTALLLARGLAQLGDAPLAIGLLDRIVNEARVLDAGLVADRAAHLAVELSAGRTE